MRFTDMLKPKTEIINQDGKNYEFTPGINGSLTVKEKRTQVPLVSPSGRKAKIIMPKDPISIGATRG